MSSGQALVQRALPSLVAALFWWHGHHRYQAGVMAERATWVKNISEANLRAEAEARAKEATAQAHNAEVRNQYEADIASILADRT